jgi:spermidine synthase
VLYYQVKSGILYQDIGILLMGFMLGLAMGALVTDSLIFTRLRRMPPWYGTALCAGFTLFCLATSLTIRAGVLLGLCAIAGMLLITGFLVAGLFAYASLEGGQDQRTLVAPLYAADLVGGGMGSVAGTLLLIPTAGLVTTAAAMAPLALLSILLLRGNRHHG